MNISIIKVREICGQYGNEHYVFVSCPEVLLGAMAQVNLNEIFKY